MDAQHREGYLTGTSEPVVTVGIMDFQKEAAGRLNGGFACEAAGLVSGEVRARTEEGIVSLAGGDGREIARGPRILLAGQPGATFTLLRVIIGNRFHWERAEDQTFHGNLVFAAREDGSMAVINEIRLEDYLKSVISSEMKATAPEEFLKVHSILSRSWLLSALKRKKAKKGAAPDLPAPLQGEEEVIRWYEQEEHDLFDVCADDHCQRYQGITKIVSRKAEAAASETYGKVIMYGDEICDARYSKACGGLTEEFRTAWDDCAVPYLTSIPDSEVLHRPIETEEDAARWIMSEPEAYCNLTDEAILREVLPDFDQETKTFFRWKAVYTRQELETILREKSGIDFGTLEAITPLTRGPSGRIYRLEIKGSKRSVIVGKELEIRRWLSPTHLYSSAFVVSMEPAAEGEMEKVMFYGAGWGHGVGLCQIGAAAMAVKGFKAEEIMAHYFPGTEVRRVY